MPSTLSETPTPRLVHDKVGFIGLGNMGLPMAINLSQWLAKESYPPLTLWSRSPTSLSRLPESDAIVHATSMADLVMRCDVVFTSLSTDPVVVALYQDLFKVAEEKEKKRDKTDRKLMIFCDTSTIYPRHSGELERAASKIPHTYYLQTPVFGPPNVAKEANLLFVLSGDHYAKRHIQDLVVPSMGRKFLDVGSNVERASAFKLGGNMITLGIIEILAESLLFADQVGVGSDLLMEFVKEFLPAPDLIECEHLSHGTRIQTNSFEAAANSGFTVEGGLQDANHIRHLAAEVNATIPTIDTAHRNLITSRASGGGLLDWSSLVAGPRLAAGVQPFTGLKTQPRDTGFGSAVDGDSDKVEVPVPMGGVKTVQNF